MNQEFIYVKLKFIHLFTCSYSYYKLNNIKLCGLAYNALLKQFVENTLFFRQFPIFDYFFKIKFVVFFFYGRK